MSKSNIAKLNEKWLTTNKKKKKPQKNHPWSGPHTKKEIDNIKLKF